MTVKHSKLRKVVVFIASPGDTSEARRSVRRAVDHVNRLVAEDNSFILQAIGWEDIPPGRSDRAQEVINPYVDSAHVFIGILNRRFGSSTGVAESGTEEEYNRVIERWEKESAKPDVQVYFKGVTEEELKDPGPELQRVLAFKKRIANTDFYREYATLEELRETIEIALKKWIAIHAKDASEEESEETLSSNDLDVLAAVVSLGSCRLEDVAKGLPQIDAGVVVKRLGEHGLLDSSETSIRPTPSNHALVSIFEKLNIPKYRASLLKSRYFTSMLEGRLGEILLTRFHCEPDSEMLAALRKMARVSPAVATYLMTGETTDFDLMFEHARSIGQQKVARENAIDMVLQGSLLRFIQDALSSQILHEIDGKQIEGMVIRIRASLASTEGREFDAGSVVPVHLFKAGGTIERGAMVSASSPALFVTVGTTLLQLDAPDLALEQFERALSENLDKDARYAALTNKGLALIALGRLDLAILTFRQAVDMDPNRSEAKSNLERAERGWPPVSDKG